MRFVKCCFQLVSLGAVLVGIYHLVFWKKPTIEDSIPITLYTKRHFFWMKTSLWCGWWWFILLAPQSLLFYIIVKYPLFIAHHSLFLKWNVFFMCKWRVTWGNMARKIFSLSLTHAEPKHQSDRHNQTGANGFWWLIWTFWVCRLPPTWCNVDCSQLMS